jgi:hypothetical protein
MIVSFGVGGYVDAVHRGRLVVRREKGTFLSSARAGDPLNFVKVFYFKVLIFYSTHDLSRCKRMVIMGEI